jgi:hypothetical protein
MPIDWNQVVAAVGSFAVGAGLLAWLIRALVKQALSRDLEQYKADLVKERNVEMERLRADHRIAAFERETRFSALHQKRAEVVADFYKLLSHAHSAMARYMSPLQPSNPPHSERAKEAAKACDTFIQFFEEHRVYFAESFCAEVDAFRNAITDVWIDFDVGELERTRVWGGVWKQFQERVPPLRQHIEKLLRRLMAVEDA